LRRDRSLLVDVGVAPFRHTGQMPSLTAAHVGYEYQDLLTAIRLVDVVLGTVLDVHVDEKLVDRDRFDDLTTIDIEGSRVRSQFKHTENDDRPLTLATFTNDGRGLRLDRLISCMLADRVGAASGAPSSTFRVVLRDQPPDDSRLTGLLIPALPDPGPFVDHMETARYRFDAGALWAEVVGEANSFSFVRSELPELTLAEFDWVFERLVIELRSPAASFDLTRPGDAEEILLRRMRADVGAEAFPNTGRHAVDVANAFISVARSARQGRLKVSLEELLHRAQIRRNFGAVTRADPVDRQVQVLRTDTVDSLFAEAASVAQTGGYLLVTGQPGQGKSWVCQQLLEKMAEEGWLVAEHYCFLGDADGERLERVLAENLFGSLLARLADEDPSLVEGQRPRFAADENALLNCLKKAHDSDAARPVALVVDGLDHITRVRSSKRGMSDPALSVAETLSSLEVPEGCVLVVFSQPGIHLAPFDVRSPSRGIVPGFDDPELRQLAIRQGVIAPNDVLPSLSSSLPLVDAETVASFLIALMDRSKGNALYATYLCREVLRSDLVIADPVDTIRRLPQFDGTLENYYTHLQQSLEGDAGWVAEVVAVATFGISRAELREIIPEFQHHVDGALDVLSPVLVGQASLGGIRIYHESFGRFLRRGFLESPAALVALITKVTDWLETKGFFADSRAFQFLLPLLAEAERHDRVADLVGLDFVERSIAGAFPASAIKSNLGVAIRSAATLGAWPTIVRYVELSRAAETYESERYDSTLVEFADVYLSLLGCETVAGRMLDEHRLVVPARAGLQMCAALDRAGGVAPWPEYMTAYVRESENDNTSYGETSNRAVFIAWTRGRLRLTSMTSGEGREDDSVPDVPVASEGAVLLSMNWSGLADSLSRDQLAIPEVTAAILDTHGPAGLEAVLHHLQHPEDICLAVAELVARGEAPTEIGSAQEWCTRAIGCGIRTGTAQRLLSLGVDVNDIAPVTVEELRTQLLDLTQRVQEPRTQWDSETVDLWMDLCSIAARRDPISLDFADALIIGQGWYRCWLRFVIALSRAEASVHEQSRLALVALDCLKQDLRPFVGDPRSIDLYMIHDSIGVTIRRAIQLLHSDDWINGIRTLKDVSEGISTTLSGELGGPVPIDAVLEIMVTSAKSEHVEFAKTEIESEIEQGSAGRYYSDLASYRLLAARLAIRNGKLIDAERYWREACAFMSGYGWHKDITIFELLDPLDVLISADSRRGRIRVAQVQGLCERVPYHTDRRETRGAWARWWELLATADPVALVDIVSRGLLAECNEPNAHLYEALEDVWRAAARKTDAVVAGALRLSLDATSGPDDAEALRRLLDAVESTNPKLRQLMVMLMARVDERPVSYSYTNADEILAEDDLRVDALNRVASAAGLPLSISFRDPPPRNSRPSDGHGQTKGNRRAQPDSAPPAFPKGPPGLSQAIRAWRNRPYDSNSSDWSSARFASVIGYRLVELAQEGRSDEAESTLHTLADFIDFGDRSMLLAEIAEGLERHELHRLSATAFALEWTRTRSHGGWLNFGGQTELESLQRATNLDPQATLSVVADEVERFVLGDRSGTYGITQALVIALAAGAVSVDDPLTTAFAAWDEAWSVIDLRAPIVHSSDLPRFPYSAPAEDDGGEFVGNLDEALSLATMAGIAHPSRERKRRTLVALDLLLALRPGIAANALAICLEQPSDPATLCWFMSLILDRMSENDQLVRKCESQLIALAESEYLTVRATARRLLGPVAPGLPSSATPHPALLRDETRSLWSPTGDNDFTGSLRARSKHIVEQVAGMRIRGGEVQLPGLEEAIVSRVENAMETDSYKDMMQDQLRSFADQQRKRWPDAYLIGEQTVEETLQLVAGGGRTAYMVAGKPLSAPEKWEEELGLALLDNPTIPITIEWTRQPRPIIPIVPSPHGQWWVHVREDSDVVWVEEDEVLCVATVSIEPASSTCRIDGGQFDGWFWLATYESRHFSHPDFTRREEFPTGARYRVAEVRDSGDPTALGLPPITAGHLRMWRTEVQEGNELEFLKSQPLVGLDVTMSAAGDGRRGLGVPTAVLTPSESLLRVLHLFPDENIGFRDHDGAGLGLATWRADYEESDYHLPIANTTGCGIAIRSDLLDCLIERIGARLIIRDFVMADTTMDTTSGED
jgi:hypothetical protein